MRINYCLIMLRRWKGEVTVTNMEEMIILNREILARTTPIQIYIWVVLWLAVFFGTWKIIRERAQETYKIVLLC